MAFPQEERRQIACPAVGQGPTPLSMCPQSGAGRFIPMGLCRNTRSSIQGPWSPPSLLLSQTRGLNHCTEPQEREGWECRTQKQKPAPNRKGETPCQRLCQLEDAGSHGNRHRGSRQGHLADVGRPWQDLPTLGFLCKQRDPSSQTILDGRSSHSPPGKGSQPACTARVRMTVQKRLKAREE